MHEHTEHEQHERRRAEFARALGASVNRLFNRDPAETELILTEWLADRAILVLTPHALWARLVDDASGPDGDAPRPEPGARWPAPPPRLADMPPSTPDAWAVLKAAKELGEDAEQAAVNLRAWEHVAAHARRQIGSDVPGQYL